MESPCFECPVAMQRFCSMLWDGSEIDKLSEIEREEFGYQIIEAQTINLEDSSNCSDVNINCPINDDYLDWVLRYRPESPTINQELTINS